jgi:uncharacterized protein involved in response to NO
VRSPAAVDWVTGRSSIGQTGVPVRRSRTNRNAFLFACISALIRRPSTVMSPSMAGPTFSHSHRLWCTVWKCQTRLPVFASRATTESAKRLSPGRQAPHAEAVGAVSGT